MIRRPSKPQPPEAKPEKPAWTPQMHRQKQLLLGLSLAAAVLTATRAVLAPQLAPPEVGVIDSRPADRPALQAPLEARGAESEAERSRLTRPEAPQSKPVRRKRGRSRR